MWHTPRSAAKKLGVSRHTLPFWRRRGYGPAWIQLGPRLYKYSDADLEAYLASNRHPGSNPAQPKSTTP
jgi:DNA-binding transcriptional MerR regulator